MKTINDILNYFEEFAPCATQMSFDNAGLIVGDKCTAVSRVLVALDITEDVVNEAESLGCELIISHHPVIFAPIKRLSPSSVPYMLAQKGISAVCMHTNLDLGEKFGVNICLADALGVKNPVLSELGECMFTGELESETDIHDFAKLAKKNAVVVKVSKPSQDKRFDIPAIGLKTLKTMKRYKADLIAVEANETIIVDQEKVIKFADDNDIVIMAV